MRRRISLVARVALVAAAHIVTACGPSCPASTATRPDLTATPSTSGFTVKLPGNRLAQMNEKPARLKLAWSPAKPAELVVTDAAGRVRLRARESSSVGQTELELRNSESGEALAPGIYRVEVIAEGDRASAGFEICHCTVFY